MPERRRPVYWAWFSTSAPLHSAPAPMPTINDALKGPETEARAVSLGPMVIAATNGFMFFEPRGQLTTARCGNMSRFICRLAERGITSYSVPPRKNWLNNPEALRSSAAMRKLHRTPEGGRAYEGYTARSSLACKERSAWRSSSPTAGDPRARQPQSFDKFAPSRAT